MFRRCLLHCRPRMPSVASLPSVQSTPSLHASSQTSEPWATQTSARTCLTPWVLSSFVPTPGCVKLPVAHDSRIQTLSHTHTYTHPFLSPPPISLFFFCSLGGRGRFVGLTAPWLPLPFCRMTRRPFARPAAMLFQRRRRCCRSVKQCLTSFCL